MEELQVDSVQEEALEKLEFCLDHQFVSECTIPTEKTSPTFSESQEVKEFFQVLDFSKEALELFDLVEDGILYGRPVYRQIKYAVSLGGFEYAIDGLLQLYDDRDKDLTITQRIMRAGLRSGESFLIDAGSQLIGVSAGAALQANLPIPVVPAGVGYIIGTYATSAILDNIVTQVNPGLFNWLGLGGP